MKSQTSGSDGGDGAQMGEKEVSSKPIPIMIEMGAFTMHPGNNHEVNSPPHKGIGMKKIEHLPLKDLKT
jgi:hypothetical protein